MYKCSKCEREFTTVQGKGKHEKHCGNNEIGIDNGYEYIIGKDGKPVYIHRKIMAEKLGRSLLKTEIVHHKDELKTNNDEFNLEITNLVNHGKHHYKSIPHPVEYAKGSCNGNSKLKEEEVRNIKEDLKNGIDEKLLCKIYNVSYDTVWDIKHERTWKHMLV
jgi:hypothetical protein